MNQDREAASVYWGSHSDLCVKELYVKVLYVKDLYVKDLSVSHRDHIENERAFARFIVQFSLINPDTAGRGSGD